LKTFQVIPPKVPDSLKEQKYIGPKKKGTDSWRSLPVIGSLIFVCVLVIWFLVKRLSEGAGEEEAGGLSEGNGTAQETKEDQRTS
jgi:hypothetical protein